MSDDYRGHQRLRVFDWRSDVRRRWNWVSCGSQEIEKVTALSGVQIRKSLVLRNGFDGRASFYARSAIAPSHKVDSSSQNSLIFSKSHTNGRISISGGIFAEI